MRKDDFLEGFKRVMGCTLTFGELVIGMLFALGSLFFVWVMSFIDSYLLH